MPIIIGGSQFSKSLSDFLGVKKYSKEYEAIKHCFASHNIDDETAIQIINSYEARSGHSDSISERLTRISQFLSRFSDKEDILSSLRSVGMMSKQMLEENARETGDWLGVIKSNYRSESVVQPSRQQ